MDPHHFDADPDSTYHPSADPDADPDSDFLFDADPDPTFHPFQKHCLVEKFRSGSLTRMFCVSPVFRIHDILVWIRIRGSMPLTNGSGSCYFRHRPSRCQQKTNFLFYFFCLLLFEDTFTSFFKDKMSKRVTK